MRALFPAWMDHAVWAALLVLALGGVALLAAPWFWQRSPWITGRGVPVEQPVQFDHRHHVLDDGIDCAFCHGEAFRSPHAGVPSATLCMGCHAQIWNRAAILEPVRRAAREGTSIRWRRVHRLPHFVFFDHQAHVSHGVGCVTCHGRVDLMAQVYPAESLGMHWCLDCHREPERFLRPLDRITDMEWVPPRPQAEIGRALRQQLHVDPPTDCTGCHR